MTLCHIRSLTSASTGNIHVCKNEINNSKKYKSLSGPIYLLLFSLFGPTTKKNFYISQYLLGQ